MHSNQELRWYRYLHDGNGQRGAVVHGEGEAATPAEPGAPADTVGTCLLVCKTQVTVERLVMNERPGVCGGLGIASGIW